MTVTEAPAVIRIAPQMERIIEHMLEKPKARHCAPDISRAAEIPMSTVGPILRKMEQAGWVESEIEPRGRFQPRRHYRFTTGSATMLRKAIR